ncbi:MAG TPA: choline/ethanolamine kinase family protein [Anaerolineales bacterium]|nr:choline/ethanolamine kinase family protein [Anaerolineales bacterium]
MIPNPLQYSLARIPLFAEKNDLIITELSGGITNRNYKIEMADGSAYVLRVGGNDTGLLGIDRQVEYGCTLAASRVGVAPEPVAFLEPEGYLVTRFVAGVGLPAETIGSPQSISRVVAAIKRYHALDHFPGSFSPFRVVGSYLPIAQRYKAPLPENMAWLLARVSEIEQAFLGAPLPPVACHNDLLNGNFIDDGNSIRILDWEYAGMGDRFFDLGNFSAQHQFNVEQDEILLKEYFGVFTKPQFARLQLMKIMSDMREAMWAMVQCNVSQIEFDYVGYGVKYFRRIESVATGDHYTGWLKTANET